MLQLHPVVQRAVRDSAEIHSTVDHLDSTKRRFIDVAHVFAKRAGRPLYMNSPAGQDLTKYVSELSSLHLSLREQLQQWVVR
jgi:hypothetical protein